MISFESNKQMNFKKLFVFNLLIFFSCPSFSQTNHFISTESDSMLICNFSTFLELPEDSIAPLELFRLLDCWRGVKYKYAGEDEKGIDCSGFVQKIYSAFYNMDLPNGSLDIFHEARKIKTEELIKGDLLFFKIRKNEISHIGFYLGNNKFIHASVKKGVIISDLNEAYYKKHFFKAGRCIEE